ncbi:hypothetical protein, partial [Amycolatopsis lexingtonensis]|uniref:hypothetical protein n=1 Tax=Amycolatopsis lexingtonensis TaxID=218822 RepID=UPI0013023CDC
MVDVVTEVTVAPQVGVGVVVGGGVVVPSDDGGFVGDGTVVMLVTVVVVTVVVGEAHGIDGFEVGTVGVVVGG